MNYREQLKNKNYLEGWHDARNNNIRELNQRKIRIKVAKYQYKKWLEQRKTGLPF